MAPRRPRAKFALRLLATSSLSTPTRNRLVPASASDIEALAALHQIPGLSGAVTRDKKRYSNLPYSILAAIFSINAQIYDGHRRRAVERWPRGCESLTPACRTGQLDIFARLLFARL
jgi:hypothetical protein